MKIVPKGQNLMEWIAIKANLGPAPLGAGLMAILFKATLLAFKLDVFEAAKDSSQTLEQIT